MAWNYKESYEGGIMESILIYQNIPFMPRPIPSGKKRTFKKSVIGPTINFIKPKRKKKQAKVVYIQSNAACGKRHKDEVYGDFLARRKVCNAKRRQREKDWYNKLKVV